MPIVNRVADLQPDIQAWRRDIHENPELLYDVHRTAHCGLKGHTVAAARCTAPAVGRIAGAC